MNASTQEHRTFWWEELYTRDVPPRPQGVAEPSTTDVDVLVVGSGPAGYAAAIAAHDAGSSVLILEAGEAGGGTAYKAAGIWIPNNHLGRANGYIGDRTATLRYMAKLSYPDQYNPDLPRLGLPEHEYSMLETLYDRAGEALKFLEDAGALKCIPYKGFLNEDAEMVNYHYPLGGLGLGQHIAAQTPDGRHGSGAEIMRQLGEAAHSRRIELAVQHRVVRIVQDACGAVVGVEVETPQGTKTFKARQGVVFASGGFTHNPDLIKEFFKGRIFGGGAVSTNVGDFVEISRGIGAPLVKMENGWLAELPLLTVLESPEQDFLSFVMPGDSLILVNTEGRRVVNEKMLYQERGEVHFEKDEDGNFPNEFLIAVYDDFVAHDDRPNLMRYPNMKPANEYVASGKTPKELASAIEAQMASVSHKVDGLQLDPDFADNLRATLKRFNRFAEQGVDEDFGRGGASQHLEHDWMCGAERPGNHELHTMYPFDESSSLHAIILVAATLDTNGGPMTTTAGQVLGADHQPIPGLYAVGNCAASPSAGAYWTGGVPIGSCLTFGYIAGHKIALENRREDATAASRADA